MRLICTSWVPALDCWVPAMRDLRLVLAFPSSLSTPALETEALVSTRRKFDPEFREGTVRVVLESGRPVAQGARDPVLNEGKLGNWVTKARPAAGGEDAPLGESERSELTRLRAENAEWRMQHDALKRSTAG